jgi:hypothetical protein
MRFDSELTAEELRMMQAMGIPFTFDTTQVMPVLAIFQEHW